MATIGITGSTGFIGSALLRYVADTDVTARPIPRDVLDPPSAGNLTRLLEGCAAIIHCAALTPTRDPQITADDYDRVNHLMTRRIADCAADAGVRRFVFLSSIAAVSGSNGVLTPQMTLDPAGAYGLSKAKAENALMENGRIQSLILRPPLIYGPGVKADLRLLVRLCDTAMPLPFGAVHNQRSMLAITDLVDALLFLATMPELGGPSRIFHVCDAQAYSLRQLVTEIRVALSRPPRLVSLPPSLLQVAMRAVGFGGMAGKLFGDLIVDRSDLLASGWSPCADPQADLVAMALATRRSQ